MAQKVYYPIKVFKQESEMTCGVVAARMILDFWGVKTTEKELKKEVLIHDTGTWLADLAKLFETRGLKTRVYSINLLLFNPSMVGSSNEEIKSFLKGRIKNLHPRRQKETKKVIEYIELGGDFVLQIPKVGILRRWLKKQPLFIPISRSFLYKDRIDAVGHYIVVNGFNGKKYSIVDPARGRKDKHSVDRDILEYAWLANNPDSNGYLMVVLGKK